MGRMRRHNKMECKVSEVRIMQVSLKNHLIKCCYRVTRSGQRSTNSNWPVNSTNFPAIRAKWAVFRLPSTFLANNTCTVSFLVASMSQSQQTIASLQFDLDVERGRIADFEARLEDVEDSNDVRDASLILVRPFFSYRLSEADFLWSIIADWLILALYK